MNTPTPNKTPRRLARELVLQGLYQWQLTGNSIPMIEEHLEISEETAGDWVRSDRILLRALLTGTTEHASELETEFVPHIDRPIGELSPIERAIVLLGVYELKHCPETPYRVILNEAIELAKNFGGTEGHRFVNGVLDKCAARLRAAEVEHAKKAPPRK